MEPIDIQILQIAKRLIEKHYTLELAILNRRAIVELPGISTLEITASIKRLISNKILFNGSALTKEEILPNSKRHLIFDLIQKEPGIHYSKIRRFTGFGSGEITHHLLMLKKFGFIRSKSFDNNEIFFDSSFSNQNDELYYYLHKKHAPEIFKEIISHPGISINELTKQLEPLMSVRTVSRKIKILAEKGFLVRELNGENSFNIILSPEKENSIKDFCAKHS